MQEGCLQISFGNNLVALFMVKIRNKLMSKRSVVAVINHLLLFIKLLLDVKSIK